VSRVAFAAPANRVRRLALACAVAGVVAAATAAGGSTASRAEWGSEALLLVDSYRDVVPELDVTVGFAPGAGAPSRLTLFVPSGFDLYADRAPGAVVGSAIVYSADYSAGASVSLFEGDIVAAALPVVSPCAVGVPSAVWTMRLAVLGQLVDVPIFVSTAGSDAPPGSALRLDVCAPALAGAGGGVLPIAAMKLSLPGLELPQKHGVYVWHAVVTPTAPDRRTELPNRAYELRAVIPVPHSLTLAGRYDAAKHVAVLHGRLSAAGVALPNVKVSITRLVRLVTPGGVVFHDSSAGTARTSKNGTFTFSTHVAKTTGFVAYTRDTVGSCEAPAFAPGGCATATTAGLSSDPITVSVPSKAKRG